MKDKLFIISGPSGAGEDSIIEGLKRYFPIERVITTTTREKRSNIFAKDPYYFMTKEEFKKGIKSGIFFEYVEEDNSQLYGVTKKEIERVLNCDKIGVWKIEYKGVMTIKKLMPEIKSIFISVPSLEILKQRLLKRGESKEFIQRRMVYAREWLRYKDIYDYEVINHQGKLDEAIEEVKEIILKECEE